MIYRLLKFLINDGMTSFGVQILKAESVNHAAGQRNIALNSEQKKLNVIRMKLEMCGLWTLEAR